MTVVMLNLGRIHFEGPKATKLTTNTRQGIREKINIKEILLKKKNRQTVSWDMSLL